MQRRAVRPAPPPAADASSQARQLLRGAGGTDPVWLGTSGQQSVLPLGTASLGSSAQAARGPAGLRPSGYWSQQVLLGNHISPSGDGHLRRWGYIWVFPLS